MIIDTIGAVVGFISWFLFVVLPLGLLIYIISVVNEKYDEGPPMDYMLEKKEEDVS